jgi:hypothetical protein
VLFNDPETTKLFVGNILLSPPNTTLKTLFLEDCGLFLENQYLMAGFHQNTTIGALTSDHDATIRLFIDPILRRNKHLAHVNAMLGRTSSDGSSRR